MCFHQKFKNYECPGCLKTDDRYDSSGHEKCKYALVKLTNTIFELKKEAEVKAWISSKESDLFENILPFGDVTITTTDYRSCYPGQFLEEAMLYVGLKQLEETSTEMKVEAVKPSFYATFNVNETTYPSWNELKGEERHEKRLY